MNATLDIQSIGNISHKASFDGIHSRVSHHVLVYLKLPVIGVFDRLDGPVEFFAQSFGKELFDRHIKLLGEDNRKARINIVLELISISMVKGRVSKLTILLVPSATSLLPSRSSACNCIAAMRSS